MKKLFTLVAVASFAVAANAQTTTWKLIGNEVPTAETVVNCTTTANNIEVAAAKLGSGMAYQSKIQTTHKINGEATAYFADDATLGIYKIAPQNEQVPSAEDPSKNVTADEYKVIDCILSNNQYVEFPLTINNNDDYLSISSIVLKVARFGTDDVRVNVMLTGAGDDGEYKSDWLINAENGGANYISEEGKLQGFQPSREDDSKANSNSDGFSTIEIAAPADLPAKLYEAKVLVGVYGISKNKDFGIFELTVNHNANTALPTIINNAEVLSTEFFTVAGTKIDAPAKGVNIVKYTLSDGTTKVAKFLGK